MDTKEVISFFGWGLLTYTWLRANLAFFNAIANVIDERDKKIRRRAVEKHLLLQACKRAYDEDKRADDEDKHADED